MRKMNHKINENDISFERFSDEHRNSIIDILNYYIENEYSAYREEKVAYEFYNNFLTIAENYPAFAIKVKEIVVGFSYLNSYNPCSSFKETAVITYFINKDYKGKGIGKTVLSRMEVEAKKNGIKNILANISSVNEESLVFHSKNGFVKCGEFDDIITKRKKVFSIIWMQKKLN